MPRVQPRVLASEWGPDFTRGVGLSAILHLAVAAVAVWAASRAPAPAPPPAYVVELTDPAALGGRVAFGPLDRPLGRPRRIADAAGGAPAGTPGPGESAGSETARPAKGVEARKPVAQAKVAQAPKLAQSEEPVDSVTAITPPRPPDATIPKPPEAARPVPVVPPKPVAAPKPPDAEVTVSKKTAPREETPPATVPPRKAETKPDATAVPQAAPQPAAPVHPAVTPTTVATATTIPAPATSPDPRPPEVKEAAQPKVGTAGPVTAHPTPAPPQAATPPSAAPQPPSKAAQPPGAADGARIVPAKPLAPLPHHDGGIVAKPAPDVTARADGGAGSGGSLETPPQDEYAAAAERWRSRMAGGMGGMGATEHREGTVGDGSNAAGGGGTVVGFEFLSYRQRIFGLIKRNWANAVRRAGLVAAVRFEVGPDGIVSNVELVNSSGDKNYDQSVVRAVQRSNPLPPPPERYRDEFREVVIDFHSEEEGGQAPG